MVGVRNAEHAEESAEAEVLQAQAKKHEESGRKIRACLGRIRDTGSSLEAAVGPAYNDTQRLQTTNSNVDKLLAAIANMQSPLEGKADEERVIREGPTLTSIQPYLASLGRVEAKYAQLSRTPVRVNQEAARELSQLLMFGAKRMQDLFDSTLREISAKVEPLQYLAKGKPFPQIDQDTVAQLGEINDFISKTQRGPGVPYQTTTGTMQSFAEIRGRYLDETLQNLAAASVTTSKRQKSDDIYQAGASGVGMYVSGIEMSFVAEWNNIVAVFGSQDSSRAFEMTTGETLVQFGETIKDINAHIKRKDRLILDCFLGYEIIGIANNLALEMDKRTGLLKQQVVDAVRPIRDTAKVSLGALLDDIRTTVRGFEMLPQDAAAIPFTAKVMTRLQAMTAYPQPLASIMTSLGDGNWSTASNGSANGSATSLPTGANKAFDVGPDSSSLMAHYILDTIDVLLSNLESKAKSGVLRNRDLISVFVANNIAIIERMIRSSDLAPYIGAVQPPSKLDNWRKRGQADYLALWRKACAALMDVQYTNRGRPPSGNASTTDSAAIVKALNKTDKESIKDKFKLFNTEFDRLSQLHREIAPNMEREVRAQLAREIQAIIEPLYNRFWERYHEIDKGKGKHVKYDKSGISVALASLA